MTPGEIFRQLQESIRAHRARAFLTILGIVIGVTAVVMLSSIGEGTRRAIAAEFTQFGTTLVSILPGKSQTFGSPGAITGTTRRLTLEDLEALRRVPGVREVSCSVNGTARVEHGRYGRDVHVYGSTPQGRLVWKWGPRVGMWIPPGDLRQLPAVAVLGPKLAKEIFPDENPLGKIVRIGGTRFRVIGIMESKGTFLGFDLDDAAYIPVVRAMTLFNQFEVHEIHVDVAHHHEVDIVVERIRRTMIARHGEEDFTIVTQGAMLELVDDVMDVVTRGVVAIAAIAILVGAMGVLTITWVSVHERRREIGVMKAVGASDGQVLAMFLAEASLLSGLGGLAGILLGVALGQILQGAIPALRFAVPRGIPPLVLAVSIAVGALAGYLPARKAAGMDPVGALREE